MRAYPDTSFLCAFYVKQSNSPAASAVAAGMREPIHVAAPLLYEFRQSLRFQAWRNSANPREGVTLADARAALLQLECDLQAGIAVMAQCELGKVFRLAEALSQKHTVNSGHRSFYVLHVATALHLQAAEFLTFNSNQRKLALAEGMKARP